MDDDEYPVAYCAPGARTVAVLALMAKGEQVKHIREHPWLKGRTDVLVMAKPPEFTVDPEVFQLLP